MKKRILLILACMISVVMLCASPLTCFAAEASEAETPTEEISVEDTAEVEENATEDAPVVEPDIETPAASATEHTLFTRVWEYCVENRTEMLGLAGDAIIFILAIFVKLRNDKRTKHIESDLQIVKGDASGTASAQSSVVEVVNGMIDGYNNMRNSYEKYEHTEDDRNRLVGAVMVQNTALLEILTTVYVNSKNLPQGVKDLINLKYANCQKALGDDEMLRAIVEAVREKVGTKMDAQEETGSTEV